MYKLLLAFVAGLLALTGAVSGRTDPHVQPHRPTTGPTATLTVAPTMPAPNVIPVTGNTTQPEVDHVEAATPDRSTWPCQICIDVSGTPQWPSACIATQYAGGSCAPIETATPNPYP